MATIVIKDLAESIDLDRQAMHAITGGARVRGRPSVLGRTIFRSVGMIQPRIRQVPENAVAKAAAKAPTK
jgi:hypothetical protein